MPKKSSSKTPTQMQENPAVEEEKPSPVPKKRGNEIDEIFSAKKRKKHEQENAEKLKEDVSEKPKKMKKKKSKGAKEGGFVDPPSRSRKRTEDGFTIYKEEELGIGKADAGGTRKIKEQIVRLARCLDLTPLPHYSKNMSLKTLSSEKKKLSLQTLHDLL